MILDCFMVNKIPGGTIISIQETEEERRERVRCKGEKYKKRI